MLSRHSTGEAWFQLSGHRATDTGAQGIYILYTEFVCVLYSLHERIMGPLLYLDSTDSERYTQQEDQQSSCYNITVAVGQA